MREALLAAVELRKAEARAAWEFETLVWAPFRAMGGKAKAPEVPAILKG